MTERRKARKNGKTNEENLTTKNRCKACKEWTTNIKFVSAIGQVCPQCACELGPIGEMIDRIEESHFCEENEQEQIRLRQTLRTLQQLGLNYQLLEENHKRKIELAPSEERRHLTIKNYQSIKNKVDDMLQNLKQQPRSKEEETWRKKPT